jgi:hypothetical protein
MMQDVHGKLNPGFSCQKVAFNKKFLFTSKLDSHLRKRLVKCYIWSMALCGAENWTHRKGDKKYFGSFEKW